MANKNLKKALQNYDRELDTACWYGRRENPTEQDKELFNFYHGRASAMREVLELLYGPIEYNCEKREYYIAKEGK